MYNAVFTIEEHEKGDAYAVGHSFYVYVIDPKGVVRETLEFGVKANEIAKKIVNYLP